MNHADIAEKLFRNGLNCAQAVCGAFGGLFGGIDEKTALKAASPFGGGFGRKRTLCGAVSGMGLAYGILLGTDDPKEKMTVYENAAALADRFAERYDSIICAELVDKKPEFSKTPRETPLGEEELKQLNWPCVDYVRGAAQILEEYLTERGVIKP